MSTSGSIYAIGVVGMPYVKIGSTMRDVRHRLRALQAGNPLELTLRASVQVEAALIAVERHIHAALRPYHKRGEWYEVVMDGRRLEAFVTQAVQTLRHTSHAQTRPQAARPHDTSTLTLGEAALICGCTVKRLQRAIHCQRLPIDARGRLSRYDLMVAGYLAFPRDKA